MYRGDWLVVSGGALIIGALCLAVAVGIAVGIAWGFVVLAVFAVVMGWWAYAVAQETEE